ncbi:Beta-galactosidase [Candidatus Sulfotelmatomonas gaucii]|uniref:Beta-galactosidase n=1 Tax=Candidatus Sulfuritelmatomonas gaucii TaxID=2043161 RepID=A0A2N9M2F8_9BACT|nr:Beta-galactosidase [Candidatus Sulfotelmatomonas gaucii]
MEGFAQESQRHSRPRYTGQHAEAKRSQPEKTLSPSRITRRTFLEGCAATAFGTNPLVKGFAAAPSSPISSSAVQRIVNLDAGWLFGGKLQPSATDPAFDDAAFEQMNLPHTVAPLSWQNWDPAAWEDAWIYRRHFTFPAELMNLRLFLHFDRVMAAATPLINGHSLEPHMGGFLPFDREITGLVRDGDNVLAVAVDSRWLNAPPSGSPRGPVAVDYLLPGGITGSVQLRAVPTIFLREVFAKPINVLNASRRVDITCRIDAAGQLPAAVRLSATLRQGSRTLATVSHSAQVEKPDQELNFQLDRLPGIELWDPDHPHLYDLDVTLSHGDQPLHRYSTRIGFRDARFDLDGFYLNGKRTQLFGLNRHELYPYLAFAAPTRLLRRDAEILRRQFNCNVVRCSHYPQSEAFIDACDELGLMIWEELPGWQYIGDESWQDLAIRDVEAMIRRDRNHPAVIIWGVRINESRNDPELYQRTRALAHLLDDSRSTSGTMTPNSRKDWETQWAQDVFAFDDYHADPDHTVGILDPVEGHPYLIAETVGQFNYGTGRAFNMKYRRAGDMGELTSQAIYHAQAHNRTADHPRIAGAIAWCAFDYASLVNAYNAVKCPGIADVFRIPKLGASFYLAQVAPSVRPVIEPDFYWDFGSQTPSGPGQHAAIFSNCDRLELFINGEQHAVLNPDRAAFPHLHYPPFFVDLKLDGSTHPELRIDGYIGNSRAISRSFSSDSSSDCLQLHADDVELIPDGSDMTRLTFAVVDRFGAPRAYAGGAVSLQIHGPGTIVGDNPFALAENGGAGAVWIRTIAGRTGTVRVDAEHSSLGNQAVEIQVK